MRGKTEKETTKSGKKSTTKFSGSNNKSSNPIYKSRRFFFKALLLLIAMALVCYIAYQVLARSGFFGTLPGISDLKSIEQHNSSEVYAFGGELLGKYFIYDRTVVGLQDVSEWVVPALISTEDERFYKHEGTDYLSLPRVIIKNLIFGNRSAGGGSTITRQLAKNLYPRKRKGILWLAGEKVREGIIASRLEKVYSKEEILTLYLNTVHLGENVYGISAASQRYFSKHPSQLNAQEAATLVGMLKATSALNPRTNPAGSLQRRNVVFRQLEKHGVINAAQADSLSHLPLVLQYNPMSNVHGPAPYLRERIRVEVSRFLANYNKANGTTYNLYTNGLKIFTTIDFQLQVAAEAAFARQMKRLQEIANTRFANASKSKVRPLLDNLWVNSPRYKAEKGKGKEELKRLSETPVQTLLFDWDGGKSIELSPIDSIFRMQQIVHGSLLSLEKKTGNVKAYIGGNNIRFFQFDLVNSYRQAGSTFKPFVYAAAIESGTKPCEMVSAKAPVFESHDNWSPSNHDDKYDGYYSMRGAMARSVNTVSAKYIYDGGIEGVIELAKRAGFKGKLPPVPSISLGTAEVTLMEITAAYLGFANNGIVITPKYLLRIEDKNGKVLFDEDTTPQTSEVINPETALIVNHFLEAVVNEGTASSIRSRIEGNYALAGKTGTTQRNTDNWFVGYSPNLVTGVWVGLENPRFAETFPLPFGASRSAVHVWSDYYDEIRRNSRTRKYLEGSFDPLTEHLLEYLDCPSYLDEVPEPSVWEGIFGTSKKYHEKRPEEGEKELEKGFLRKLFEKIF